jgi:hypothetical protein
LQKRENIIPDQRLDLPNWNRAFDLVASEFHDHNKSFITSLNKIVKNFAVVDNGGLQVRVSNAEDSVLFASEYSDYENLVVRKTTESDLTLDLEDNATNFVELELFQQTTGEDNVAIWSPTANGGQGEEFIQLSDTVLCTTAQRLISNTISYSVGQPNRIRLATVVTSGGSIVSITDDRSFLFSLEQEWDFGVTRTDQTIKSFKNNDDAIKTAIKETKGTPNWFDAGISGMHLLERLNYLLVDGGLIKWNLPRPATGSLVAVPMGVGTSIEDGDTFTLDDGNGNTITYEFDTDASAVGTPVTVTDSDDAATVQAAIIAAINGSVIGITAAPGTGLAITLTNDLDGTAGNIAITETLSNGVTLSPQGMENGYDTNDLIWSADLRIVAPSRNYTYTVSAQTISNILDNELIYVTLPEFGTTPGGPLAVNKTTPDLYPIDNDNIRNFILGYRSGDVMYFGNSWQNVELEAGESSQLGDGVSDEIITALGIANEYDSTPPYSSANYITNGGSFTQTISELDQALYETDLLVKGKQYDEFAVSDGTAAYQAGARVKLPPPFGVGANQTYNVDFRQLRVYFGGAKQDGGAGNDYLEVANLGGGVGDEIELLRDVPEGLKIQFTIQTGGGQDGVAGSNAPTIQDEGDLIVGQVSLMNFIGEGVQVTSPVADQVEVLVKHGREVSKLVRNNTVSAITAGTVVAWEADGSMKPVSALDADRDRIIGVVYEDTDPGALGLVIKFGEIPNAVVGAAPGDIVYLSDTVGEVSLVSGTNTVVLGRAEPPDGVDQANATSLYLIAS